MESASAVVVPYWFDGSSDADRVDRRYPLRALDAETERAQSAPLTDDDRTLVQRIRAGESAAFEELYRAHAEGLIGFAFRLCGVRSNAYDAVADLFVALWERRATWAPRSGLRAYLYAAVRHRVADQLRSERRAEIRQGTLVHDPSLTPETVPADADVERHDELAVVWKVVEKFPPLRRQVTYLRWARGFTPEEIAVTTGLNRNAVDKHLSRAVQAIREAVRHLRGEAG